MLILHGLLIQLNAFFSSAQHHPLDDSKGEPNGTLQRQGALRIYDYPANCDRYTCSGDRKGSRTASRPSHIPHNYDTFEGKAIKIVCGATGRKARFEFFYGGILRPDGVGHSQVVCNDGETINFWRKPSSEGGEKSIDDNWSTELLSTHMF